MTNYSSGHEAEKSAADFLKSQGYKVVQLNWKTKYCEIDIVAKKDKKIYLIEVKSRSSSAHGTGFDYITSKKLSQMEFAAKMWVSQNKWEGDFQLGAIEIETGKIKNFLIDL